MRRFAMLLLLVAMPVTLFAQSSGGDWRNRRYVDNTPSPHAFEFEPFVGWRWGGTIFGDQSGLFLQDTEVEPSANFGANLGIPISDTGMKLELMVNHQSSELRPGGGLFEPDVALADIDVTYLHAGLQVPFLVSRNVSPFAVVSAGIANLDPQIEGASDETRFSMSGGVGVKVPLNRSVSLRFEGRGYYTATSDNDDYGCDFCNDYYYGNEDFWQGEVNMGLTFSF